MSQDFTSRPWDEENFGNWENFGNRQGEQNFPENKGRGCLKGCCIAAAVFLVLALTAAWYVSGNWRSLFGTAARILLEQTLDESSLPEAEKEDIQEQVERVVTAFEQGKLTEAQIKILIDEMAQSTLSASVVSFTIEKKYFDSSELSDEEKETGRTTLRRCVRGMFDGDLTEEDADAVLGHIGTKHFEGHWEFRDNVTDDELRQFLAEAKERADAAGVAETVEEVDPSDEVRRIVDSILNQEAAGEPLMP